MIGAVKSILTSSNLASIAQNTTQSVAIETTLKSIGRPGFILIDKDIDSDTKQYAAAKEFLYQATCLAVYMALIVPIFKKGGFKLAKEKIYKNTQGFEHFKNVKEYMHYKKLADNPSINNRLKTLDKELIVDGIKVKDKYNDTLIAELHKEKPETFKDQLKPILSNERLFFTDLYKDGVGEKIEGMFREMLAGPGAVRATIHKYVG